MKKLWIILIGVFIVVGIAIFIIFNNNEPIQNDPEPSGDIIVENKGLAEQAKVVPVSIIENASGMNVKINVVYPSIQSFENKNIQKYINDEISKVILAYRDEIKTVVDEQTLETKLYSYESSFERYNHGDYLSLVISNDYETGGIRTNKWKDIYNINVKSERFFYLADIFPANVDYEYEILNEINKQAEQKNYTLMNGAGLKSLDEKQKFFIKDEKLIIYFDPSEIAPTTYGELQFEMPFVLENGIFKVR